VFIPADIAPPTPGIMPIKLLTGLPIAPHALPNPPLNFYQPDFFFY